MIPDIVFIALRYFFLFLLYLFLILVVRAIYRDVAVPKEPALSASPSKKKRDNPELVVLVAEGKAGPRYPISGQMVLGRSPDSDIILDDTYVSQKHARIYPRGASIFVEDLGSTNGTYVNGRKISYPLELRVGDRIKIGKTVFEFIR